MDYSPQQPDSADIQGETVMHMIWKRDERGGYLASGEKEDYFVQKDGPGCVAWNIWVDDGVEQLLLNPGPLATLREAKTLAEVHEYRVVRDRRNEEAAALIRAGMPPRVARMRTEI